MYKSILLLISALSVAIGANAQSTQPAPKQSKAMLITNVTVHTGSGTTIENGAIGFRDGIINYVGEMSEIDRRAYDDIIDYSGKHVYPGFIVPDITLGITEMDAVRATRDFRETGSLNPHVRSIIAYNTESDVTSTVRSNGILMGQITPRGGLISGTSSVVQFDAWNWEDAAYRMDDGIHMNWPNSHRYTNWGASMGAGKPNKSYSDDVTEIRDLMAEAMAYSKLTDQKPMDLRMEAMRGIFDGSKTLYVTANNVKEIVEVVNLKRDFELTNVVIKGGYESWMVADMLRENNIAIILVRLHSLPARDGDNLYAAFELPAKLEAAGVLYCLGYSGDMEAMGCRNLPFVAGTAAAYGLTKEQALKAITLNTAKILGIDAYVGSLAAGKYATFFVSDGDALDMRTNNVVRAFIQGRDIELSNRQKELAKKYEQKYEQK